MMKDRLLLFVSVFLTAVSALAQQPVGNWDIYSLFSNSIDDIIETPSKVYYLSGGNLYSYDTENDESYSYSIRNKLSDNTITGIYYNYDNGYLFVAYDNGNIDMIYDNGRVVNMPQIKDAVLTTTKNINEVAFGSDRIAVVTDFGIVVFNDQKHEVVESAMYSQKIEKIAIMDDNLLIYYRFHLYYSPLSQRHNSLDKFTEIGNGIWIKEMYPLDGNVLLHVNGNDNRLYRRTIDFDRNNWTDAASGLGIENTTRPVRECKDGLYAVTADEMIFMDDSGSVKSRQAIPSLLRGQVLSTWNGVNSVWAGNGEGIGNYDISGGGLTVLSDKSKPEALTCREVAYLSYSNDGKRLYVSNIGATGYKSCGNITSDGVMIEQTTNIIEDGKIRDVSLKEASADVEITKTQQAQYNTTAMMGGVSRMIEDPDDPSIYYIGNTIEGLYVIKDGVEIGKFNSSNTPMLSNWGTRVFDVNIDAQGNLWVGFWSNQDNRTPYVILPAGKRRQDPKTITAADWITLPALKNVTTGWKDMGSVICGKSNMVFMFNGSFESGFVAYDTNGTPDVVSDDKALLWTSLTDQDAKSFVAERTICMVEDKRGRVWVGTSMGVIEITNPANATNPAMTINRIKVPRNDGTNYADYLLETDQINCIAVDPSDRKWIATEASGVYLVSENGDKILEHYTTDNSYLPSNTVYSVVCDPNSNMVYFGTGYGLVSYSGSSSPAMGDYSDVYAYPNPVRPDYTGWITITGLMDNSLVKIADASGNVFYQTRSEGGMVTWDGCNSAGERVRSGVYFVFASQNGDGGSSGVVTKILVIN